MKINVGKVWKKIKQVFQVLLMVEQAVTKGDKK